MDRDSVAGFEKLPMELPSLTPLRGVAAVWVFIFHLRYIFVGLSPFDQDLFGIAILGHSYLWVDFFFLLSGFTLAHRYFRTHWNRQSYFDFLKARLAKIYPVHLLVLGAFLVFRILLAQPPGTIQLKSVVANLFLLQSLSSFESSKLNYPAWSISCEWIAFLLFPFILFGVSKIRFNIFWGVVFSCSFLLAIFMLVTQVPHLDYIVGGAALLRCGSEMIAGILLYRIYLSAKIGDSGLALVLFLIGASGLLFCLANERFHILFPVFSIVTIYSSVQLKGAPLRWINARGVTRLGEVSYSLYMIHALVLASAQALILNSRIEFSYFGCILIFALVIVITLALAMWLTERFEKPWNRRIKALKMTL